MARAGFPPEPVSARSGENLHFYGVLCVFQKISKSRRSQISKSWSEVFTATRTPKEAFWLEISNVFACSMKKGLIAKPLFARGGGRDRAPRDTKRAQSLHFYRVFLSCTKSKKGPRNRHSRGQVVFFVDPRSPREAQNLQFYGVFSLLKSKKHAFLQGFGALGEQPGAQRERNNSILPAFLQGFVHLGWESEGWQGERILGKKGAGNPGPGIMSIHKEGGIFCLVGSPRVLL